MGEEMEDYTQPLIQQINALSADAQQLILCRIARIFPEIIQKEIKSVDKMETKPSNETETEAEIEVTAVQFKSCDESKEKADADFGRNDQSQNSGKGNRKGQVEEGRSAAECVEETVEGEGAPETARPQTGAEEHQNHDKELDYRSR